MTAIITDRIKQLFLDGLVSQIEESSGGNLVNRFYIGIGRSEQWDSSDTAPIPINSWRQERQFRYTLQSVKGIEGYSFVIPRRNWIANTTYRAYDDNVDKLNDPLLYSYYVINEANDVYICVRQGVDANGLPTPSLFQPTTRGIQVQSMADGYVWKYMYSISQADASNFLTANFMPVKFVDSAGPEDPYYTQFLVKQNAATTPQQIIGYKVVNPGSGYTTSVVNTINTNNTIVIKGDGTGAKARLVRSSSNTITSVEVQDSGSGLTFGKNYNKATVSIPAPTSGITATAIPVFGPKEGLGYNPVRDLQATAMMFNIKPTGNVSGTFVIDNDFRQIGLLKNMSVPGTGALFTGVSGRALRSIKLPTGSAATFNVDTLISTDSATAYVDYFDTINNQTEATGFGAFAAGKTLTGGSSAVVIQGDSNPDVNPLTGDLLYIDNRSVAIERTGTGSEDIKIVIQL